MSLEPILPTTPSQVHDKSYHVRDRALSQIETNSPSSFEESGDEEPNWISRDEANVILANGYPTDEQLDRFPLGHLLKTIPAADPRYGRQPNGEKGHIEKVIDGINILVSDHPERIVKQWEVEKPFNKAISYESAFRQIFSGPGEEGICRFDSTVERDAFFRILALYHDIGKAIITERHPVVGWHLVNDVHRLEVHRQLYPFILGKDFRTWNKELKRHNGNIERMVTQKEMRWLNIFHSVIRYHDYFGILGTGEGSLPIMVDLIELRGTEPNDAKELFAVLMIFTLADVYGSVKEIFPQKVDVFCRDWERLCDLISQEDVSGDRQAFYKKLLEESQTAAATVDRLWRLMYEGAPKEWQGDIVPGIVEKIFKEATLSRMYPFIKNFALFCKLDYCLNFKITLMNLAKARNQEDALSVAINAMITLLAELEKRYGELCLRNDRTWRRLGFEMAGLTRKPTNHLNLEERKKSRIGEEIGKLLLNPGGLGKEWSVSECTVWFMEE